MRCRTFPFESADGPANMALDEALLDLVARDPSCAALRTYGWSVPTLSLGYFQEIATAERDDRWRDVSIVRRPTGGGAIWHHHELTYALVIPGSHHLAQRRAELYHATHAAIAEVLHSRGIEARHRGPSSSPPPPAAPRPFLCFCDRDPEDLVVRGQKIVGSAQRRRADAILQHGSMLLKRSPTTPELAGAADLLPGVPCAPEAWSEDVAAGIARAFGLTVAIEEIPDSLRTRGHDLERTVYRDDSWNRKR